MAAAALAVVAAYPIAMVTTRKRGRFSDAAESAVWAGLAAAEILLRS